MIYVVRAGRETLFLPDYNAVEADGRGVTIAVASHSDARAAMASFRCVYYASTSLCSTSEGRTICQDVERGFKLNNPKSMTLNENPTITLRIGETTTIPESGL